MNEPGLAAAKARAVRHVANTHWEDFLVAMRSEGWEYTPWYEGPLGRTPRQWHRIQESESVDA